MHTSSHTGITYLRQIAAQALELGLDVRALLSAAGLREHDLVDSMLQMPIEKISAFATEAIARSGATGFGVLAGRRLLPSSHGIVGLAAAASPNIRAAMQMVERFVGLRTGVISIRTRVVHGRFEVCLVPALGLGAASNPVTEIAVVAVKNIADDLVPQHRATYTRACFNFPEPPHGELARAILGCEVRYGQTWSGLSFALSLAEQASSKHDPLVLAEAMRICTEEFKKLRSPRWPPQTAPLMAGQTAPGRTGWIMTIPG
jgi:hypothetical protein